MNATVANVTSIDIKNGSLQEYDILVVPGGSETTASSDLDSEGRQMIRDYVKQGGSYFGICGGATFGARYLGFFRGYMSPLNEPGSIIHLTSMQVNQSCVGPDLSGCSENFSTMYYASQYFVPNTAVDVHVVATYEYNGEAGMVAFEHENGTVFLSSPHPEYEEMSDRDNTSFGSDLDDPDSEWDMLLQVSKWLVDASYVEASESSDTITNSEGVNQILPFLAISSVGIAAVVILATIVFRRR
jgi:glutamine amidotransferase PdxT